MSAAAPVPVSDLEVRAELERVISSRTFARSQRQRRFIAYIVDATLTGRTDLLREQTLGMDIFERGPDFDPRADNIVRVEARRLRQRLEEYYSQEGAANPIVIQLPVGGYVPTFEPRPAAGPAGARRPRRRLLPVLAVLGVVLVAAGLAFLFRPATPSLAVLPFAVFDKAESAQMAAASLSEDLTQACSELPNLRVVARTSALRFKDTAAEPAEIGRRLGVRYLLEGSLDAKPGLYHVSARLIDVRTGFQVWSGAQDMPQSALRSSALSLAGAVAAALRLNPPPSHPADSTSAVARDLFLRARYLASQPNGQARLEAVQLYRNTVAADPRFAIAWAELARTLSLALFHDPAMGGQTASEIRSAAARALQLDPNLADAHFALARLAWCYDGNWAEAEPAFLRTLALNPNYASAHQAFALALAAQGRSSDALAHSRRAIELNPLSFVASNDYGVVLYCSHQFSQAVAHANRALELNPASTAPRYLRGVALTAMNQPLKAIPDLEAAAQANQRPPIALARLALAYQKAGRASSVQALYGEITTNAGAPFTARAWAELAVHQNQAALNHLIRAVKAHEPDTLFRQVDPAWAPLRTLPRFP